MRRYRAMTLVETLMAILITLILGGALMAFLRSGLSLERAIAVNVSNQQSLRFPFWRLPPLVERANGLEILTVLPEAGTLSSSEIVAYVAASNDSQNLSATENNMYLRTNSGDTLIPGFSHISGALFERVPLFSGALPDSKDQAVRLTLTAENSGVELVYSADMRSLNRIPVAGPDSGPFLKIDLYGFPVLSPFIQYADVIAGVVSADPIPKGTATLVVGTNVAGYFQILSGNPFSTIEYEWRLYSDILDVGTDRHEVIGKPGGSHYPSLQEHYDDRFTSADVGVSPPTGTSAHTDPPYVLNLKDTMVNKHITFAVREVGSAHWFESRSYLITRKPAQSGEFWDDLIKQLRKDIKEVQDGKDMKDRGYEILNPLETNASMSFQEEDGQTALTLKGTGGGGSISFFSKLLEEKYFGYQTNGERDPGFCLENYTIWVDAEVSPPVTSGWGATINGNRKANQYGNPLKKEHLMYGYMLQFDPGLWTETKGEVEEYFNTHKTIGSIPDDKRSLRSQGLIIRELTGYSQGYGKHGVGAEDPYETKTGKTNNYPGKGLTSMRRWRKATPPGVDPLDPDYSREFIGRGKDVTWGILLHPEVDWNEATQEPSALAGVDYRRYLWRDVAYKEEGFLPSDEFGGEYSNRFAVSGDVLVGMRNVRYTTEINVITQTTVRPGSNPIVTEPDRIFFRVRVYDKPRVYDSVEKKWSFPRGTGRSKAMWFGLERGKNADWVLPANSDKESLGDAHLFEAGDVSYKLAPLENKNIKTNQWHTNSAVGKHFGVRVWNWTTQDGSKFEAKIYFVDITKGLPLDFKLPWKSTVGDIIKPIAEGGTWNPKKPYELKQY